MMYVYSIVTYFNQPFRLFVPDLVLWAKVWEGVLYLILIDPELEFDLKIIKSWFLV